MYDLMAVGVLGLLLGFKHATDADHVVAISTIVARYRTIAAATLIGVVWGVGHTITVLSVGIGVAAFGWVLPESFGPAMEFIVGLMLIGLGVVTLWGWQRKKYGDAAPLTAIPGAHTHAHGDYVHTHAHASAPSEHPHKEEETPVAWLDRHFGNRAPYALVRPLLIGVVHGLAGSAAIALLVLPALPTPMWSVVYLLVFGVGTVFGMMIITALIATPMVYSHTRASAVQSGLTLVAGVGSLVFGLVLAYHMALSMV